MRPRRLLIPGAIGVGAAALIVVAVVLWPRPQPIWSAAEKLSSVQEPARGRTAPASCSRSWCSAYQVTSSPNPSSPPAWRWTTVVTRDVSGTAVTSGLRGLVVLKTADSAFSGFPRDEYTTLPETRDRILATSITAAWRYAPGFSDFGQRSAIRAALVETFAVHRSESVQQTLYAMGQAALSACTGIVDIQLSLPNRHHLLVNLEPFGLELHNNGSELVFTYDTQAERTGITRLLAALAKAGIQFRDLSTNQSSLEDIFVNLVKRSA